MVIQVCGEDSFRLDVGLNKRSSGKYLEGGSIINFYFIILVFKFIATLNRLTFLKADNKVGRLKALLS